MIYTNPGNGVKDVVGVYINPGNGVKEVQAVWENVGGTLYQVWPVAHTAYDGSTFKGALNSGLVSGFSMYCILDVGGTAASRMVYSDGTKTSGTANTKCLSGEALVKLDDYDSQGISMDKGWRSKNLVNLSLYDSISVSHEIKEQAYCRDAKMRGICLINQAGTQAIFVENSKFYTSNTEALFDVSSVSGSYYVLFLFHFIMMETSTQVEKYAHVRINSISFA